jgi:hypothetical protein
VYACPAIDGNVVALFLTVNFPLITPGTPNWCEAILGHNLKKDHTGRWRWRFVGEEMKIGMRRSEMNVFDPDVPPEVAVNLEEFLLKFRPLIKNADQDQHVFLSSDGGPLSTRNLRERLSTYVMRYTNKHIYPHLLRSLFSTYHLTHGVDINSVAYALNDTPKSVLGFYNELIADTHRPIVADANRQALTNGNAQALTPPVILVIPKPLRSEHELDQMPLL